MIEVEVAKVVPDVDAIAAALKDVISQVDAIGSCRTRIALFQFAFEVPAIAEYIDAISVVMTVVTQVFFVETQVAPVGAYISFDMSLEWPCIGGREADQAQEHSS